jgi:hypothetical protein
MRVILFFLFVPISTKLFSQTSDPSPPSVDSLVIGDGVFERVDIEATFRGGEAAWRKYLEQNLEPNVPVENGGSFHIKVNNPGKAILYINSKKRNKQISPVYFVVKKKT